ncbi:Cna B-type domain-containing protein [Blautia faecis]|uniref:Cna B-type domain-containing protein n=7 Tax=Clostridia TaxID=186801 RepID=UPI001656732D|nr:Cna B-type domain-containing protein [Blautia faecis]MBC8614455.1 Cna B-type domain-containing protein [Blautia faecis]
MKKNGYLRRFLALFLALVMIMADSSVTTFAATVGRVKQKSAAAETENQQTVYTYEDSKVTVTATLENADAVPDNAKFVVTKMNKADHQDGYAYAEQKLKEYEELENVLYDSYLIYDMHFEDENGNEIEPAESQVSVNISYKKAQKLSNETTEDSVQVLHLDENLDQLEDVTDNVELNKKGKIKEVTLTTDSFSTFIIADQGLSSFKLRLQFVDSQGNVATSQNGTYYAKIEKDGLHQFKKITVENGIGEATFDALYDNNGNRQKSIETGEYKAVLAIARPDQNPNVEGQKQNNWDTNNALSEVDNGQTFDYQFTIAINDRYTVDSSHDTVVINATQMGNNSISYADIKDGLKDASQFMVVANYFEQSMHFEGNFAVDKFKGNGNPVGAQGTEKKINLTINIEKSVNPAAAKTFNFRIVDANKNKVADVTITTDANGVGSTSYTIKDAKSAYEVYELDEKGNILEDGGKIGDYTVSYDYSEGLKGLMNYDTTSFAKVIEGVTSLTANSSNNLFVTTSEVTTDKGAVKKVTAAEFDSLINITNILTTVSGLSKKLAKAKSTDSAQVVYLTPSDLKQHRLNLPAVRDNQALVINVMIPSGMNELDVATEVLYVGNEIVDVAGKKESELDPNSKGQQIAKRTIWNFVNEDGTPYKGYVKDTGKKMGGFALVPEGSYMNNNGMCSIYAKNVYQGGAEIHKNSFPGDQEKSGTVKISNRKDTPEETSVSVKKVWNDSNNQDGIRPDSVTVQLYADGKASGAPVDLNAANNWSHTWSGLAKKANKTDIKYTVDEVSVPADYTKTVSTNEAKTEYVITNTHVTETTEAMVKKVWNDSNDQDGKRPAELTVNLMNGNTVVRTVTLNAGNNWTAKVTGLAKKANGTDIAYSWSEGSMPTGYSLTDTSVDGTVTTLTNTYAPEETSVSVRKVWDDSSNQDGIRPASVTVQLYADGTASGAPVDLNAANNWSHTWTKLAKKANKTDIEYTVDEVSVPADYTKTVSANEAKTEYVITNTHVTETTEATVKKVWNDSNDQDGKRPAELTVNLMNGNTVVRTVTLNAGNNWTAKVTGLAKKANGTDIAYSWSEGSMPTGYSLTDTSVDGTVTTLTNTYAPEETSVSVRKVWDDSSNQDGIRPASVTVQLYADGKANGAPVDLNAANNWSHTWSGLAKKANKTDIKYTVDEVSVPEGYTKTVSANEAKTEYVITNTHVTETTEATVKKVWNDSNDQDGKRPAKLTVNLMNGNTVVSTVTLSEENGWEATVSNLPKKENGTVISYSWSEGSMPEGYSLEGSVTSGTVTTLTNKYAPEETSVSVRKVWTDSDNQDGIRPDSITVQLKADGKESGEPVELNEANNWTHTWNGLAKKASGTEIEYSVDEVSVPGGYTKTVTANENKTEYTITNTHETEKTEATVKKVWNDSNNQDGTRPVELTVNLMNGNAVVDTVTLKEANDWSATVGNLEKKAGGKDIEYTWTEGSMPEGYKLTDTRKNGTVTTLTNTYAPEKVSITGTKTWNDANNQDGKRPTSIKISLFANGNVVKSLDVTAATNWTYSFTDLPKYEAGTEIKYTVGEEAVADYETKVEGYNITNTHKPATLDITGTKTWNDSNNQDGKRPKSITVNLLANGIITDTKTVTADDNWTYSFTDLPKYANGQEITYTVSELTVPGYTTTIDDNYNITNSYTPGETSASVTKIWDDADNQDGIRPESITVALLANGTPTNKTVTLTAANNWTQTITGLPEKADGEYITYTWTEVNVPEGYSLTGTSKNETVTTLTNTHTPELTSITGTKTWKDADNQDGKRPESITVNLFADGTKLKSQSVSADADGNWSYSFTDLPKYANGQEITYTVTEDAVDGYTTESDGYNFINTHQPETTEITGTKTWNDANNQDGKRPESITVILLANGTEKTRQAVTADEAGNWTYTFKDLPKYANGQEITYTVAEEEVTDYTTTYDGSNITNSYTPGKTSATVTKIWNDAENQDGKRPESITVSLLADGKETGKTVTLSVENNWKQTISDLPEKADGKAIEYTWTEETLPEGYELTDNSKNGTVTTLTNTYAPETTSITVTKTWDDADNQDGKRPESIIVNLLANGEIVARQTVKADEAGNWTYTFKDLPKYANGKEITYTVTEEAVEGYETSVDGFNITNTYTTETTEVKGSKTWNDADNQDGKRPESITVRLLANGEEKDSQTVTADENGNWTYSFEKLPKYEAGKEIVYTVTEDAVADYTTEITGYDITNSYAPEKTSVTVTKSWADNDDRGGHRPKEIKVQLKADGENSGEEITLNAENNWTYTWSDLDQKKAGKDIAYTVEETGKAAGYISTVTGNAEEGFIITNTITSVKISKVDITDQKELAGAHIQVIDKDGNVVEEWDSTWEAHEVTGLKPGETYTLRETVAPEGYTLTSDTTFTLKEDGTVNKDTTTTTISDNGTLLVEDSRTSVKVSKVDISDGKELEGAHIQIIDQDGNVVDEWDSTKEAHVTEKLKTGKIYTLRETVAPDGYLLTSDTTFVLKEDGTVDAEKTTAVSKDGVLLVQDKLATSASIAVTKKLTYIGEGLAARNQTFYVALYSDKECTQRVSDVKALVFKNADASTVVFSENIKAGKTYYIAECTQDGTSQTIGALADGTVYEAVFGNGNSTTVTEADGTTTVSFENVFSSFPPDGFYKQGQLTITKKVLGADGGTRNSNEVFYAGIFDDAAHTQLSQQVEQNIIKLDMDGGYEVSEIINVGLAQSGAKVTLYVTETDSNGKPIAGSEGFGYKVTVSADSVTFDETNMTAEVVITNQEESTVTETPTPTPTPSSDGGNSGGSEDHSGGYGGGKSPKTGDDTPIGTYLMLLLAAAMLAAETERRRRRNKRQ